MNNARLVTMNRIEKREYLIAALREIYIRFHA